METIVQISLDLTSIPEALETARLALRAGVDWLEAGTPLIIAEGMNGVRALRAEFDRVHAPPGHALLRPSCVPNPLCRLR